MQSYKRAVTAQIRKISLDIVPEICYTIGKGQGKAEETRESYYMEVDYMFISEKEFLRIASVYGYDVQDLKDRVQDLEAHGRKIDAQELEDLCANDDI